MRTLDEAIKHCEEKAKELRTDYEVYKNSKEKYGSEYYREVPVVPAECLECAEEHEQLAEWLKELKDRRLKEVAEQDKADAEREALREAHRLDDNEDTLAYRGRIC